MSSVALAALLAGLAAAAASSSSVPGRRLSRLRLPPPRPRRGAASGTATARLAPAAACATGALAVALLVGGSAGAVLGAALLLAGPGALARLEPRSAREERERLRADLPLALELLAACLAGGAALPTAVRAVGQAVPGPCGERLVCVAAALDVGSPAREAWQVLTGGPRGPTAGASGAAARAQSAGTRSGAAGEGPGSARAGGWPAAGDRQASDALAAAVVRALVRTEETGSPVAAAVLRLADQARADARSRGLQAAERAGVLAVGPLGLCFLPAFVLLGVVPVVVGLVGPLLAGL